MSYYDSGIADIKISNNNLKLDNATITLGDMAERNITADIRVHGTNLSLNDVELLFRGERFVPVIKDPNANKNKERTSSTISVSFLSYVIVQLQKYWFFKKPEQGTGILVDQYTVPIGLKFTDFINYLSAELEYYYGTEITCSYDPNLDLTGLADVRYLDIDYTTIWDVLAKAYEVYGVRWRITESSGVYNIYFTNDSTLISHTFKYGYNGGLTSIERQTQDEEIHNKIFGRGTDKNLPPYYFKRVKYGDSTGYESDPDALYELRFTNFTELRDAAFRWYVRGWMRNENRDQTWKSLPSSDPFYGYWTQWYLQEGFDYPYYDENDIPTSPDTLYESCLEAFTKGMTDLVFDPTEFVKDDESITKYGERWGKADTDDTIFPTMQGVTDPSLGRLDEIVDYDDPTGEDDIDEVAKKEAVMLQLEDVEKLYMLARQFGDYVMPKDYSAVEERRPGGQSPSSDYQVRRIITINPATNETDNAAFSDYFTIPVGLVGTITFDHPVARMGYWIEKPYDTFTVGWNDMHVAYVERGFSLEIDEENSYYYVKNIDGSYYEINGEKAVSPATVDQPGQWCLEFHFYVTETTPWVDFPFPFERAPFRILVGNVNVKTHVSDVSNYRLFNIWVKNIWGTTKDGSETAADYVARVWNPILGNKGMEAKVVFASGLLAISSDYDFVIHKVYYDTTKTIDGVPSEWRLELIKSEAEYQAAGKFIPNTEIHPSAGDLFYFIENGIVMPQPFVEAAEQRLNTYKYGVLSDLSEIRPTWSIQMDKVRINTLESGETNTLMSLLEVGKRMKIQDTRLTGNYVLTMYITSLTISWSPDSVNPDVEVTLSDVITIYHSPIEGLETQIRTIRNESVTEEESEQVAQKTVKRSALQSTGTEKSKGAAPVQLASTLQSPDFGTGLLDGTGWGIYRNGNGEYVLEADRLKVRKGITALNLEVDEWKHEGGVKIMSAANLVVSRIEAGNDYYTCYFDNKKGSVSNLFSVNDIALCNKTETGTGEDKYYRYKVSEVGANFIKLSRANGDHDGSGVPDVGDNIIQYGNTSDANRQHVIVIDAASGHERMLFGLNSVSATGDMYYYVGAINDNGTERRRWFVGDREGNRENFIEYAWSSAANGYVLTIGGDVYVGGGSISLDALNYLAAALGDDNSQGLVLSNQIAVYNGNNIMGGLSGVYDSSLAGGGIAAWFGGTKNEYVAGGTGAKVLFRFDGSGYVAAKHISWDAAGNCTIDGTVQLGVGNETVATLVEAVQGALQKSAVASKGNQTLPIFFDANSVPQTITGLTVLGNVESTHGGVSAMGIANMGISGGGHGTLTQIQIAGVPLTDSNGIVNIPLATTQVNGAMSASDKLKLDGISPYAQVNVLESVKVNGTALTITNKAVDVPVPTALSQLTDDATHRLVTDTLIGRWNGVYNIVPAAAYNTGNELADKAFVNSSIATATATFRGTNTTATTESAFLAWANGLTHDLNDYVFWQTTDSVGNVVYKRYKYDGTQWAFEYNLNNSSFTADQWSAINSGITGSLVTSYSNHIANTSNPHNVTKTQVGLGNVENTALSTWAGTSNITTLGTIATGKWQGTAIADTYIASASTWNAKYAKPTGGIPDTDMTTAVQTALSNANTAYGWGDHAQAGYALAANLGTAATHAHGDYVTAITYDATNKKLQQSKGGGAATDIVTFGSNAFNSDTYAGGTAVTLNGTSKAKNTASFYAPTSAGTAGQYLKSTGGAPAWEDFATPYIEWSSGTSAGPKLQIFTDGGGSQDLPIPTATAAQSGVVIVGSQTFGGAKSFDSTITAASHIQSTNGNIEALHGGVSAMGIANLSINSGGGQGTLTQIKVNGTALSDVNGVVNIPLAVAGTNGRDGAMSNADKTKLDGIADHANNYTLPVATSDALGGIRVGYGASGKYYAVQLDNNNKAYVYVPWSNTEYTFYDLAFQNGNSVVDTYKPTTSPSKTVKAGSNVTISAASNVITIAATDTTYTFASGDNNGQIKVTPSGGSAQNIDVTGLDTAAFCAASDFATSGHTHATSIAASTNTNQLNLSFGTKYALTAGGTKFVFTMPTASISNGVITIGSNSITPLTGITSSMVTTALGYTPYDAANFTQANIKSTLGISDWALASSKPSYQFSEISNRQQAYIDWGGPNIVGSVSPLEVATIDDLGHNKFAFASAATITAQYSRDGGSTWTTFGADNERRALLTLSSSFYIGNRTGSQNTTSDKLRIILNANRAGGNIYTSLKRLLLLISTEGSGGCTVKVERKTIANYNNNVDTWDEIGTYGLSGWSGWNSIPCGVVFGGASSQTSQSAQIRLTFGVTSVSSTYNNLVLIAIRGIGFPLWQSPSTMASTGHLYSFDISGNAAFPAGVSATSFTENGTALSSKYLGISAKAADSDKLDGNDSSYFAVKKASTGSATNPIYTDANGAFQACTYSLNKTVPSDAVFTDTTYSAGTGLSLSGTTFNHSNSVTAQTTQALYPIKIDAQGHISAYGTAVTSLPASDVYAWAKAATKPSYAFSEITGTASDSQIPTLAISKISGLQTALDNKLETSLKGAANGLAELDANGLVPSSQLPSYVDDVLEYANKASFPTTGVSGKIYVALDTNLTYRWSGSAYVEISPSLALGETSSTAYRGDRGKTAYDHATETKSGAQNSGFYKFSVTAQGHISGVSAVIASDLTSLIGSTTYAPYNANGYLPLSGGTITGSTSTPLIIQSTNNNNYITFQLKSKNHYRNFGLDGNGDLFITNLDGWANEYKIWHTGNMGAGSGLNADKVDGYHASELYVRGEHRYGLENYIYDVVAGGQTTRVDDDTITTSGTTSDTYFFIKTTENLVPDEIYTFGFYVEGYTGTGTWTFYCSNNATCIKIDINKNGWVWGTGTAIPSGGTATSQLLIDDAGSGNARALTFSKFIMVRGYALPAYVKAMRKQTIGYASALTTDAGGATTPVYFSNGVPVACTSYANASVNYANSAGAVAWTNVSSRPTKLSDFTDDLGSSPTHTHSQYLEKVTYEWNKSIAFGSTGYLLIGKFPMYDSNITIDIDSTTYTTYHGTLVIATQNINTSRGGTYVCNVYGDATNSVTSAFVVQYSSGSNKFNVYFKPLPWSKNLVHIRAVALAAAPTESEICTSVSSVPTTDLLTVTNALTATFLGISATAASATKLTTVSKTAWGQTFWTSGGIPATISGNMSNVGDIAFSASGKNIGGLLYFDTTNRKVEVGTSSSAADLCSMGGVSAMGIASMAINSVSGVAFAQKVTMNGQNYEAYNGAITLPNYTATYNPSNSGSTTEALSQKGAKTMYTALVNMLPSTSTVAGWGYKKGMVYTTSTASSSSIQVATGADPTYQFITNTSQSSLILSVSTSGAAANTYGVHRYIMIYNDRSSATTVQFFDPVDNGVIGPADSVSIPANSYMEFSIIHPASNAKCMVTWSTPLKDVSMM